MRAGRGRRRPTEPPPAPQELPPPWMLGVEDQKPPKGKWTTPPFDPRFPNQNQTRNCYQNFLGETWGRGRGSRGGKPCTPRPPPPAQTVGTGGGAGP